MDWAPDWCISLCADMVEKDDFKSTFFVTHDCDVLGDLNSKPWLFETGIHPNFQPGSSHGSGVHDVLNHCLEVCPEASAMRTHSLHQSSRMFQIIDAEYPQLEVDVSLFLPFHKGLAPVWWATEKRPVSKALMRIPYYWEDDTAALWHNWSWDSALPGHDGIKIFNFHPIHVALNMSCMDQYEALKEAYPDRPLHSLSEKEVRPFVNPGAGSRTFLSTILQQRAYEPAMTISEIARHFRKTMTS